MVAHHVRSVKLSEQHTVKSRQSGVTMPVHSRYSLRCPVEAGKVVGKWLLACVATAQGTHQQQQEVGCETTVANHLVESTGWKFVPTDGNCQTALVCSREEHSVQGSVLRHGVISG